MTLTEIPATARKLAAADLRAACRAIDALLNAKPPRKAVMYAGCSQPINTRERYLVRKAAMK